MTAKPPPLPSMPPTLPSGLREPAPAPVTARERLGRAALRLLVALGPLALAYYLAWWHDARAWWHPLLAAALAGAFAYSAAQLVGAWVLYLAARRRPGPPPLGRPLSVDVFVT